MSTQLFIIIIHVYNKSLNICIQIDHYSGSILEVKTDYNQSIDILS